MSASVTASAASPVSSVAITSAISALTADSSRRRSTCDRAGSRSATLCASKSVPFADTLARLPSRTAASGNLHAHDQECSWRTSCSAVWPDCAGQPAVCADPCHGPAGGKIEYVGAAPECIDAPFRADVGRLEAPAAREPEGFCPPLHAAVHLPATSPYSPPHPHFFAPP